MDWGPGRPGRTADDGLGPPSVNTVAVLRQSYWEGEPNPAPYGPPKTTTTNKQTNKQTQKENRRKPPV